MTLPIIHRRSEAGVARKLGPYEITSPISPEEERAVTAYHVRIEPRETPGHPLLPGCSRSEIRLASLSPWQLHDLHQAVRQMDA